MYSVKTVPYHSCVTAIEARATNRNVQTLSRFLSRLTSFTGLVSTVAALVVGLLFFKLGLWQLDRAEEKQSIVAAHNAATDLPPLQALPPDGEVPLYRRVELTGRFDFTRPFLLDNRIVRGQAGFEVIVPFFLPNNQYVLANLGWIGHSGDRQVTLEKAGYSEKETTLSGLVVAPSRGLVLGDAPAGETEAQWPHIIQFMDYETIATKLDKIPVFDAVIVAHAGQAGSYTYNFSPVASGARIHLGYAFQWFAMLAALVVLYLYLMVFKKSDEPVNE